jgi:tetratricopeptide (TPR) repeat protein
MTRRQFALSSVAAAVLAVGALLFLGASGGDYARHGRESYAAGEWSDAVEYFTIAHEKNPADHDVAALLAKSLTKVRDFDLAAEVWAKLADVPAWSERATTGVALAFAGKGDFERAYAEIDRATKNGRPSLRVLESRGTVGLLRAEKALDDFRKYLRKTLRRGSSDWTPATMYEYRALDDADYDKKAKTVFDRLAREEGYEDLPQFLAAFAPVREATAALRRDYAAASDAGAAAGAETLEADSELGAIELERGDLAAAAKRYDRIYGIDLASLDDARRRDVFAARFRASALLSRAYERAKKLDLAVKVLERDAEELARAEAGKPEDRRRKDPQRERRAKLYAALGRTAEAEATARDLLKDEPRNGWANWVIGQVAEAQGDAENARFAYERAYSTRPDESAFAFAYGKALRKGGRSQQSNGVLLKALQRAPGNADITIECAEVRAELEGREASVRFLQQRLAENLRDPADIVKVTAAMRRLGGEEEPLAPTVEDALKQVEDDKDSPRKLVNLARLLLKERDDAPSALERLDYLLQRQPRYADAWKVKAAAHERLGQTDKAVEAVAQARRYAPNDSEAHWLGAKILARAGQWRQVEDAAKRGLEADPQHPELRLLAAEAETNLGKSEDALKRLDALDKDVPNQPAVARLRGRALLALGRPADAVAPLRLAENAEPKDHETRRFLGEALLRSDRVSEGTARLAGVAADAAAPAKTRRAAADVLFRNARADEAADAYAALLGVAPPEERAEVAARLMQARATSTTPWRALDAFDQLTAAGPAEAAAAYAALLTLLVRQNAAGEAAEVAAAARARGIGGGDVLAASFRANLAAGAYAKALADADDLRTAAGRKPGEAAALRARALAALGRASEAAQSADEALRAQRGSDRADALMARVEIAARGGEAGKLAAAFAEFEACGAPPPALSEARDAAVAGFVKLGVYGEAERLASAVGPGASVRPDGAVLVAALRVLRDDVAGAAAALEAAPARGGVPSARALVAALGGKTAPQAGTYGAWLAAVAKRDPAAVEAAARALASEPESLRPLLARVGISAAGKPDSAGIVAGDLALARLCVEAGIAADRREAAMARAAERLPTAKADLDLLRAAWHVALGDGAKAAQIVVPQLDARAADMPTQYVAAAAAALNGGGGAVRKFFETSGAPPAPAVRRDVARLLASRGDAEGADAALVGAADEGSKLLRAQTAAARRDRDAAKAALDGAPAERLSAPHVRAVRAWIAAGDAGTRAAAKPEIEALAGDPRLYDRLDLSVLFEAAALAGDDAAFGKLYAEVQRRARFDAAEIDAVADVLRRSARDAAAADVLAKRLRLLDPAGRVRAAHPRLLTLR